MYRIRLHVLRDLVPRLITIPESPRPVLQLPSRRRPDPRADGGGTCPVQGGCPGRPRWAAGRRHRGAAVRLAVIVPATRARRRARPKPICDRIGHVSHRLVGAGEIGFQHVRGDSMGPEDGPFAAEPRTARPGCRRRAPRPLRLGRPSTHASFPVDAHRPGALLDLPCSRLHVHSPGGAPPHPCLHRRRAVEAMPGARAMSRRPPARAGARRRQQAVRSRPRARGRPPILRHDRGRLRYLPSGVSGSGCTTSTRTSIASCSRSLLGCAD